MALLELIKKNQDIHGPNGYIESIRKKIKDNPISDITDNVEEENQYVDLVLEGGGVLGIALLGYTYTLEQSGIRFLNLAGTSAGAINALLLAALGHSTDVKSDRLIKIFDEMDFNSFMDGGELAQTLAKDLQESDNFWTSMLPKLIGLWSLGKFGKSKFGINPGKVFENWLEKVLEEYEIRTTKDLFSQLRNPPNTLKIRENAKRSNLDTDQEYFTQNFQNNELAIVSTDITTESKVIFPKMGYLYWQNPLEVHPKKFVRASMAIPLFFEPVRIDNLPGGRQDFWKVLTGFEGKEPPPVAFLVDGGVTSNFPIDVFHSHDRIPLCPTFGVKLGVDRKEVLKLDNIAEFASALFDTARHNADYSFILNNDDYKQLITYIDTSEKYPPNKATPENHQSDPDQENLNPIEKFFNKLFNKNSDTYGWLEFDMPSEKKAALFAIGAKAARDFICGNETWDKWNNSSKKETMPIGCIPPFNWDDYKVLRESLTATVPPSYRAKKEKIKNFSFLATIENIDN